MSIFNSYSYLSTQEELEQMAKMNESTQKSDRNEGNIRANPKDAAQVYRETFGYNPELSESTAASTMARKLNLVHKGFGKYADKATGEVTHQVVKGRLEKIESSDDDISSELFDNLKWSSAGTSSYDDIHLVDELSPHPVVAKEVNNHGLAKLVKAISDGSDPIDSYYDDSTGVDADLYRFRGANVVVAEIEGELQIIVGDKDRGQVFPTT